MPQYRMYNGGEKKNNYYVRKKIHQKACNGSKHRNFNACDKKSPEVCATKRYKWLSHYQKDNINKGTETSYIPEYSTASCQSH